MWNLEVPRTAVSEFFTVEVGENQPYKISTKIPPDIPLMTPKRWHLRSTPVQGVNTLAMLYNDILLPWSDTLNKTCSLFGKNTFCEQT